LGLARAGQASYLSKTGGRLGLIEIRKFASMQVLFTVYQIVDMLTTVLITLVIIQFIIGLLFAFNVVNQSNQFLASFYNAINGLLDPILRPIRNILPQTGAIDFSPLALIILLNIILIVLGGVMQGA
jgi:YggT family protein